MAPMVLWTSLLGIILARSTVGQNTSVPTIAVLVDQAIQTENENIPKILNYMQFDDEEATVVNFRLVPSDDNDKNTTLEKVMEITKTGIVGIIDMSSPNVAALMRSYASCLGITYMSVVDSSYYRYRKGDDSIYFAVQPAAVEMLRVVADIVRNDSLNNVAIVYDDTFDIQNTPRRVLTNVPAQHLYMKLVQDEAGTMKQIKTLQDIEIKNIFIISNADNAKWFLGVANKHPYSKTDVNWFVLTKDSKLICGECQNKIKVIEIVASPRYPMFNEYGEFMRVFRKNFNKEEIKVDEALVYDLLHVVRRTLSNMTGLHSIVYADSYSVTEPKPDDLQQSQNLTTALKEVSRDGVFGLLSQQQGMLKYTMKLKLSQIDFENGDYKKKDSVGTWTEENGLDLTVKSLTISDAKKHYKVVTVGEIKPFIYRGTKANSTEPEYYGYCVRLLERIAQMMDFTYEIYEVEDGLVGSMAEDGSWNGVIRELIEKRADIAIGPISVMAERENVVDFTVPYYDLVGLTILMKKPKFDYSLVKFLSVLDKDVWGCIIGAFFLFSILIWIFDRLSPFSYQNNKDAWKGEGPEPRVFTFKEGIWFCMMSLTPQGGGETPRALSGRLIAATWWLFGFIIIATYTANLAAFLTVSRLETPIESLDDLSKQYKVKYAPMNGSNAQIYFHRMAEIEKKFYEIWKNMSLDDNLDVVSRAKLAVWDYPVSDKYTKLWETMVESKFPPNKEAAVERIKNGTFAFIADATVNKYQTLTNCDLWEVGEEFSRKPYALAVQEGSPLRSKLSNHILQLINQRELEELKTKWWDRDKIDCPKIEDESDGISIYNIGGVFLVIVIGSGLALITLAMECYWYKYKPKKTKKLYSITTKPSIKQTVSSATLANGRDNPAFHTGFESMFEREKEENEANKEKDEAKKNETSETGQINGGYLEMVERL